VLRVTLTRSAVGTGWFNARSWTRYPDWRTVLSLPAEDVAFVDEILTGL
jgi:hypothetical protein